MFRPDLCQLQSTSHLDMSLYQIIYMHVRIQSHTLEVLWPAIYITVATLTTYTSDDVIRHLIAFLFVAFCSLNSAQNSLVVLPYTVALF